MIEKGKDMCGGIFVSWKRIPAAELKKYYSTEEIHKLKQDKGYQSFFWSKQPILPIEEKGEVHLKKWGNRSKDMQLPLTGWAKNESIEQGKWAHLHPEPVKIAADQGYEKGVWFPVESGGFKGIKVKKGETERVYMITKEASPEYKELTKHGREPIEWGV